MYIFSAPRGGDRLTWTWCCVYLLYWRCKVKRSALRVVVSQLWLTRSRPCHVTHTRKRRVVLAQSSHTHTHTHTAHTLSIVITNDRTTIIIIIIPSWRPAARTEIVGEDDGGLGAEPQGTFLGTDRCWSSGSESPAPAPGPESWILLHSWASQVSFAHEVLKWVDCLLHFETRGLCPPLMTSVVCGHHVTCHVTSWYHNVSLVAVLTSV